MIARTKPSLNLPHTPAHTHTHVRTHTRSALAEWGFSICAVTLNLFEELNCVENVVFLFKTGGKWKTINFKPFSPAECLKLMNHHVQYLSASWGNSLLLHIVVPRALALHESMKCAGEGHCISDSRMPDVHRILECFKVKSHLSKVWITVSTNLKIQMNLSHGLVLGLGLGTVTGICSL